MKNDLLKKLTRFLQTGFLDPVPTEKLEEFGREIDWACTNITEPALKMMCEALGHDPQMDHCMLPEHDYCLRCEERTPGQAPQRKKSGN